MSVCSHKHSGEKNKTGIPNRVWGDEISDYLLEDLPLNLRELKGNKLKRKFGGFIFCEAFSKLLILW